MQIQKKAFSSEIHSHDWDLQCEDLPLDAVFETWHFCDSFNIFQFPALESK